MLFFMDKTFPSAVRPKLRPGRPGNGFAGHVLVCLVIAMFVLTAGCVDDRVRKPVSGPGTDRPPKLLVVILDALNRKTLMETVASLPNFREIILGNNGDFPYVHYENVLVSIPSSSKPSNTTLLTGVYPHRHGIPSTMWFDRQERKIRTLNSISQLRIVDTLKKTKTDTIFDYAGRSGKSSMAVATQVTKGIDRADWIQQSIHLWGQAFCLNLFQDLNPIPDGAHLDRGTTVGLLSGHMYSLADGLEGKLRFTGDIPDLTVVHFVGMDIFTHYPRRFMIKENWTIKEIQKWYLREVLDRELGIIKNFLQKAGFYENTIFFFVSDHGQAPISEHVDEKDFEKKLAQTFKVQGFGCSVEQADIVCMPGASTKTLYVKNRTRDDWMTPPRLIEDVRPVVDAVIDIPQMKKNLNGLLVGRYPGERDERFQQSGDATDPADPYWFFDLSRYRASKRRGEDFLAALEPLSRLDGLIGESLNAAYMYRRDFVRHNMPDIILINKPGIFFTPDRGKFAHHGGLGPDNSYVSFVVSGPAFRRFSNSARTVRRQIDTVDMVPMAAYLAGIDIDRPIDGKNRIPEDIQDAPKK